MRRTGGTTLASLLAALSEHPSIEHEPFNEGRAMGHVLANSTARRNLKKLRIELRNCLADKPLIKHCYELCQQPFNTALMEVTTELGYRHIILDRRNEMDRVLSLELARLTGAWGSDEAKRVYPGIEAGNVALPEIDILNAIDEIALSRVRRLELVKMTARANPASFVVYFEDVYSDPVAGRDLIGRLMGYIGIDPAAHQNYDKMVDDALRLRGQNTARVIDSVPNLGAVKAEIERQNVGIADVFTPS